MKAAEQKLKVALWMYRNDNGLIPQNLLRARLENCGAEVFSEVDLRSCYVFNGLVFTKEGINLSKFDCLFHMNADDQSDHQLDVLKALEDSGVRVLNNYADFAACQDKFATNNLLRRLGFSVPESMLIGSDTDERIVRKVFSDWKSVLVKPRRGHGAKGIIKFDDCEQFMDFLGAAGHYASNMYLEQYIEFGDSDIRVEVFNGKVLGGYSRRKRHSYKTNISAGGVMTPADISGEIALALAVAEKTRVTGTIIDMVKSVKDARTYILEVNPSLGIFVESAMMAGTRMAPEKADPSYSYDHAKINAIAEHILSSAGRSL
ncbi:ATP-grasp domain-containing protein [Pseudomonas sp. R1-18]|uniref:ATP-grasp domain-containing protein n=1 Tax=Pseudomonas sp. R1-18 TaxID=1632772 RepID=UPI003DA93EA9